MEEKENSCPNQGHTERALVAPDAGGERPVNTGPADQIGIGLRTVHYNYVLAEKPKVGWFEIISENFMIKGGRPLYVLDEVRKDYPVAMHGVSLSIGSQDDLNPEYLKNLKTLMNRVEPFLISDHLCWTGVNGYNGHDLWPLPYTQEALERVVEKLDKVQNYLGRQILLENASTYAEFAVNEMPEWEFLSETARRADCGILFDINNVFVSCHNHGLNPYDYLDAIPHKRVRQIHLAGPSERGQYFVDTHDHPVRPQVWEMYKYFVSAAGQRPTLLEWDDNIPEFPEVLSEARKAQRIIDQVKKPQEKAKGNEPA